eukprot:gene27182-32840_t
MSSNEDSSKLEKLFEAFGEKIVQALEDQSKALTSGLEKQSKAQNKALTSGLDEIRKALTSGLERQNKALIRQSAAINDLRADLREKLLPAATPRKFSDTSAKVTNGADAAFTSAAQKIFDQQRRFYLAYKLLVGDKAVKEAPNPNDHMNLPYVDFKKEENVKIGYAMKHSLDIISSTVEKAGQAALRVLATHNVLHCALDISNSSRHCPFFIWKDEVSIGGTQNTFATNTSIPDLASTACPMLLEIKGSSSKNQYELLRQTLLRTHWLVEFNCLLKEVVCFASTGQQHWALRVTKDTRVPSDCNQDVVVTYMFNFIVLPSAGHISIYWNELSSVPSRFFERDWWRILSAVKAMKLPANFMGYHKVSWEARTASHVYTIHRSEVTSVRGVGKAAKSYSNNPLCTVKVNCADSKRVQKEFDVMKKLLTKPSTSSQSAYLSLFHVLSCCYFKEGAKSLTAINSKASELINQNGRDYLETALSSVQDLSKSSTCWWSYNADNCKAHLYSYGIQELTVTVMRSGVSLDIARSAPELGCSQLTAYPMSRSSTWMEKFLHPAGILHCDCRPPNLMVFKYNKSEVKDLPDPSGFENLVEYQGGYVDVQLIDFDLAALCDNAAEAKSGKEVKVNPGAQKDCMVPIVLQELQMLLLRRGEFDEEALKSMDRLPWSTEHDIRMLWCMLSDRMKTAPLTKCSYQLRQMLGPAEDDEEDEGSSRLAESNITADIECLNVAFSLQALSTPVIPEKTSKKKEKCVPGEASMISKSSETHEVVEKKRKEQISLRSASLRKGPPRAENPGQVIGTISHLKKTEEKRMGTILRGSVKRNSGKPGKKKN